MHDVEKCLLARSDRGSSARWLVFGGLLLFVAAGARAQNSHTKPPPHDALLFACEKSVACKSHLDTATQLYEQGRYSAALDEFQAAYILQPYPPILFNIARLHHKQNHLNEAVAYYQRYLDTRHEEQAQRTRQLLAAAQSELESQAEPPPAPLRPVPLEVVAAVSAAPTSAQTPSLPVMPAAREPGKPFYRRWWFGTLVGVAVIGAAMGIGLGIAASGPDISGVPRQTPSFNN